VEPYQLEVGITFPCDLSLNHSLFIIVEVVLIGEKV
jgi:hypothetical protein